MSVVAGTCSARTCTDSEPLLIESESVLPGGICLMRFEARELPVYAEPVSFGDLKKDSIYFFVNFTDEGMLIPTVDTVVYIGDNLEQGDVDQVYFQDIDSFNRGVKYGFEDDGGCAMFQSGSESELGHVFTFEKALDQLLKCSLRREERSM